MQKSFRTSIRVTWILVGFCVLAFLAMLVLPRMGIDWRVDYFYLFFSIPLFLFCAILLPLLYYYQKKYLKGAQELLSGKHLVHWTYHTDAWNRFVEDEWKRTRKKALWTPLSVVVGVVVLGYFLKGWNVEDFKLILPWILGLAVVGAFIVYVVGLSKYSKGRKKVGELYVGESGLYFNDSYYTWDAFGTSLGKVQLLEGDPKVLQFEIRQISKTGTQSSEIRVPVPHAHEKEAVELVRKFLK